MVRDHAMHADAALERARLKALAAHETKVRASERERERARIVDALLSTSCTPANDWPGCVD